MRDILIGEALIRPKECYYKKFEMDKEEVQRILKGVNLDNVINRMELSRKIQFVAFLLVAEEREVLENLKKEFSNIPRKSLDILNKWQKLDGRFSKEEIIRIVSGGEIERARINLVIGIREMVTYYEVYKGRSNREEIINKIKRILKGASIERITFNVGKRSLKINEFFKELEERVQITEFSRVMAREYGGRIEKAFKNILEEEEEDIFKERVEIGEIKREVDLEDELFSLFSSIEEPKEEKKLKEVTTEEKKREEIEILKERASILGYKVCKKEEVVVSKEKYEKLIKNSEEEGIKILKELAKLSNGASLSELYNVYKNINNTSIGNIEATLSSLFTNLSVLGFEPIEEVSLNKEVRVKKEEILKKYIFEEKVQNLDNAKGRVKYYGWSYRGERVLPTVLKIDKK